MSEIFALGKNIAISAWRSGYLSVSIFISSLSCRSHPFHTVCPNITSIKPFKLTQIFVRDILFEASLNGYITGLIYLRLGVKVNGPKWRKWTIRRKWTVRWKWTVQLKVDDLELNWTVLFLSSSGQPVLGVDGNQMRNIFLVKNVTSFVFAMFTMCDIIIIDIANSTLMKLWSPVVIVSLITAISRNVFNKRFPRYKLIKRFCFFEWLPASLSGLFGNCR